MVAGGFDYLVKARVADMTAYRRFSAKACWRCGGAGDTDLCGHGEVKRDAPLPVG